jgi:hypothetical protein
MATDDDNNTPILGAEDPILDAQRAVFEAKALLGCLATELQGVRYSNSDIETDLLAACSGVIRILDKVVKRVLARRKGPISHVPGKGLVVSTRAQSPRSAEEKVVSAKSIIQAVVAAHDSASLVDANYDIHWPLKMVIELLEQAADQIDRERLEVAHG